MANATIIERARLVGPGQTPCVKAGGLSRAEHQLEGSLTSLAAGVSARVAIIAERDCGRP
jgi:hypothetical protein